MVARNSKSDRSPSPCYNLHMELENKALRTKNGSLTQSLAKLQQENAELLKQITMLQADSFEVNSKYNNLKNVISIIDSTTKTCLPKLTEVVDTFTGIIQLCSVAANISNSNRDTRTQTVKPQIVNGHVLNNPIITLSRLSDESSLTPTSSSSQNTSTMTVRPGTSRSTSDGHSERRMRSLSDEQDSNNDSDQEIRENEIENNHEASFASKANKGVSNRRQTFVQESDSDDSDGELNTTEGVELHEDEDESHNRLQTILELPEAEEDELPSPRSPRSKQRRYLQGRLQEVRIYLNQLPNTFVDQLRGSSNISISVSPPERRSSYEYRSSSLLGEANETQGEEGASFLNENIALGNRTIRTNLQEGEESLSFDGGQANVSVSFECPISSVSQDRTLQYTGSMTDSQFTVTPSMSSPSVSTSNDTKSTVVKGMTFDSSEIQDKTSTTSPLANTSGSSFNQSNDETLKLTVKDESSYSLKGNITRRRKSSGAQRRVAKVLLNKLSLEKRGSGSPIKKLEGLVNTPPITNLSKMKTRSRRWIFVQQSDSDDSDGELNTTEGEEPNEEEDESRRSGSPLKKLEGTVNTPPITKLSRMKTRSRSREFIEVKENISHATTIMSSTIDTSVRTEASSRRTTEGSTQEDVSNVTSDRGAKVASRVQGRRKKESLNKKSGNIRQKSELYSSPSKRSSPGRPKRAARPKTLKEPSLTKKMRRS